MLTKTFTTPRTAWTATETAEFDTATVTVADDGTATVTASGQRISSTGYRIGEVTYVWSTPEQVACAPHWVRELVAEAQGMERAA